MDNHQSELAEELGKRNNIMVTRDCASEWTTENGAAKVWEGIGEFSPVPFLGGGGKDGMDQQGLEGNGEYRSGFQRIVDQVMGFG